MDFMGQYPPVVVQRPAQRTVCFIWGGGGGGEFGGRNGKPLDSDKICTTLNPARACQKSCSLGMRH